MQSYRARVHAWMLDCFGPAITVDRQERVFRFLEESLELCQVLGATEEEARELVKYVFGRPVGNLFEEAGGVVVTFTALCNAAGLDAEVYGERELERCIANTERIRAKHASKPAGIRSPLPGAL